MGPNITINIISHELNLFEDPFETHVKVFDENYLAFDDILSCRTTLLLEFTFIPILMYDCAS